MTFLDRFWSKVDASGGPTACWLWRGTINTNGYGRLGIGMRGAHVIREYAHRLAYILHHRAPLPAGTRATIDHLCRVPACCNPAHLELVSSRENLLRGMHRAAECARTGTCVRGHPFTEATTYRRSNGYRHCRQCVLERQRIVRGVVKVRGPYGAHAATK